MKKKMITLFLICILLFISLSGCFDTSLDIPKVIDFTSADLEVVNYEVKTSLQSVGGDSIVKNVFPTKISDLPDTWKFESYGTVISIKGDIRNKQDYRTGHFDIHVIFCDKNDFELFREADALCCIKPSETMDFEVYAHYNEHKEKMLLVDHVRFDFEILFNTELIKEFESYDLSEIEIIDYSVQTNWYHSGFENNIDGFYHDYPDSVHDWELSYIISGSYRYDGDKFIDFYLVGDFFDENGDYLFSKHIAQAIIPLFEGIDTYGFAFHVYKYLHHGFDKVEHVEFRLSVDTNYGPPLNYRKEEDSDGDGLEDWKENIVGTKVDVNDSDGDGLTDGEELNGWSVAALKIRDKSKNEDYTLSQLSIWDKYIDDIDGDGDSDIPDEWKPIPPNFLERGDINNDGKIDLKDENQIFYLSSTIVKTNPLSEDTDGDDIDDINDPFPNSLVSKWEICVEGIDNLYKYSSSPLHSPTVKKVLETWYSYGFTDYNTANSIDDPKKYTIYHYDHDGDGISISAEQIFGTKPGIEQSFTPGFYETNKDGIDTDKDGVTDLQEILNGDNPRKKSNYIDDKKKLGFVEIGLGVGKISAGSVIYFDIDDLFGFSQDGINGWITIWISGRFNLGVGIPITPFQIDAGLTSVDVKYSTEEDNDLSSGFDFQLFIFDFSNSIHMNPSLAVSYGEPIAKFDIEKELLKELLNDWFGWDEPVFSVSQMFPILKSINFLTWLGNNIDKIILGSDIDGVRNAEINGEG